MDIYKFLNWAQKSKENRKKKLSEEMMDDIFQDEGISTDLTKIEEFKKFRIPGAIIEEMANLYIGRSGAGGKLFMTKKGLEFHSHKVYQNYDPVIIPFHTIQKVYRSKQFLIFNNCITVSTKTDDHRFVIKDQDAWIRAIELAKDLPFQ